eukprot:gnl/TRDRNA2_/TRDRNA2_134149_c0_seq1.p1 gnl/TRDRNA2_/TRDRNA2_134149_c0~~gnl/TRDRNA2_/TRDRNA2_134149_c0_seq1.p1  ORF type:complete len:403 (-),score=76.78 gnl/TRDRNA2_/TRDRNA2_134149_c0_seq1:147-1298(-)
MSNTLQVEKERRRLTVCKAESDSICTADVSDTKKALAFLSDISGPFKNFVGESAGQPLVLKSCLPGQRGPRQPKEFTEKDQCTDADASQSADAVRRTLAEMHVGMVCKKGLKPESPNQDSFVIVKTDEFTLLGVFDGHGPNGHDVSEFAVDTVVKLFLTHGKRDTEPEEALVQAFKQTQNLLKNVDKPSAQFSGTTATVAFLPADKSYVVVGHVGDSRGVLGRNPGGGKSGAVAQEVTQDHKPNLPEEQSRIEECGGRVVFDGYYNHRVFTSDGRGGLNMSRALGDTVAHGAGVSEVPEVVRIRLDAEKPPGEWEKEHLFLVLASDGVWEFVTNQVACDIIGKYPRAQAQNAVEELAKVSFDHWMKDSENEVSDDITAILMWL